MNYQYDSKEIYDSVNITSRFPSLLGKNLSVSILFYGLSILSMATPRKLSLPTNVEIYIGISIKPIIYSLKLQKD